MIVARYAAFDSNRFSRPYLARVLYEGGRVRYHFMTKAFKGAPESGGYLEADLDEGDFILYGQQDYMGLRTTSWIGVLEEGQLVELSIYQVRARLQRRQEYGKEADK